MESLGSYPQNKPRHFRLPIYPPPILAPTPIRTSYVEKNKPSNSSSGTGTPSPDPRLPPLENKNSSPRKTRQRDLQIILEDDVLVAETTAWRRSHEHPGKLVSPLTTSLSDCFSHLHLCNKCGLAERKPPPAVFPEIVELEKRQAMFASLSNRNTPNPPPPMSTVPHARSTVLPRCRQSHQKRQAMGKDHGTTAAPISIS